MDPFSCTCSFPFLSLSPFLRPAKYTQPKEGRVAITRVANLLLCMYAKETVGFGMLKAKVRGLCRVCVGGLLTAYLFIYLI